MEPVEDLLQLLHDRLVQRLVHGRGSLRDRLAELDADADPLARAAREHHDWNQQHRHEIARLRTVEQHLDLSRHLDRTAHRILEANLEPTHTLEALGTRPADPPRMTQRAQARRGPLFGAAYRHLEARLMCFAFSAERGSTDEFYPRRASDPMTDPR